MDDDEQEDAPLDFGGDDPPDDPDDPQDPPRQRRRTMPFPRLDSEEPLMDFEEEPSIAPNLDLEGELSIAPTTPAPPEEILDSPTGNDLMPLDRPDSLHLDFETDPKLRTTS